MRTPYYVSQSDDFVMDEMCACGHLKSEHGSRTVKLKASGDRSLRIPNDGSCCNGDCRCPRYRWVRFVYMNEYTDIIRSRRSKSAVCA